MPIRDVAVVGLGGAGSAAVYHLARRGQDVLGLEQFAPEHARGSSHGRSRIYRTAYFEGAEYVPFVRRAQDLWKELEEESGLPILRPTGGLILGRRQSLPVRGALASARAHGLRHELLTAAQCRRRFPQFRIRRSEVAFWEERAGVLNPENGNLAHRLGALRGGAELHYGEPVLSWRSSGDAVRLRTDSAEYACRSLVLCAGPWTGRMAADLGLPLVVGRQVVLWFPPATLGDRELVGPDRMPVFIWGTSGRHFAYGVPDLGDGVKIGGELGQVIARPEDSGARLAPGEGDDVRTFAHDRLVGLRRRERAHLTCLYTNAPDHHFLIGRYPGLRNVLIVSACSGHGYKFASAVGELVARQLTERRPAPIPAMFDPGRFRPTGRRPGGAPARGPA